VTRGFLGLQVQQVTPHIARSFGLEGPRGALVTQVQWDGPGAQAGIQEGDLILELNGRIIRDEHELLRLMANLHPGSEAGVKHTHRGSGEHIIPRQWIVMVSSLVALVSSSEDHYHSHEPGDIPAAHSLSENHVPSHGESAPPAFVFCNRG
jgi:membrane-associated protease RseP (regulator of RpoE activity)